MAAPHRIVILGAGFGGIQTYLALHRKRGKRDIRITLINKTNYFLFTPLLHEVATGGLGHHNVVEAVREIISREDASFIQSEVTEVDVVSKHVRTSTAGDVPYDTLVFALGATTNFYNILGAREHSLVLKSLADAIHMRNRFIDQFEQASHTRDAKERKRLLSFAVVGAGPSGVETITEMADLFDDTLERFYTDVIKPNEVTLRLIDAGKEVLPMFPSSLRKKAHATIKSRDIEIKLNAAVYQVTPDGIVLTDGSTLPASTVIWTAGVTPSMPEMTQPLECEHGRLMVDEFLRVNGRADVYALGDVACFKGTDGRPLPMLAQVAVQQGPVVAENILRTMDARALRPFRFIMKGSLVSLGRMEAVAKIGPFNFSGPLAWFMWRTVYFFNYASWKKRLHIGMDWFVNLFYPRDITRA